MDLPEFTIAEALDVERWQRRTRGPLHGVLVVVKDCIDTGDTMTTGYFRALPVGLSFFGGAFQEPKLIGCTYVFEQATRQAPRFSPTLTI
jgi:Asp-tRNA(Asn)/Glu-tRNA(Gln) amidotransferase A subunit family amidase